MTAGPVTTVDGAVRPGPVPAGWPPVAGPDNTVVLPVGRDRHGGPVGVLVVGPDGVRYRPVVDVHRLARYVVVLAGLVSGAAAIAATARRPASIGSVTMGHGGWVSVKGPPPHRLRVRDGNQAHRRPWWARLLRAHRLVVE